MTTLRNFAKSEGVRLSVSRVDRRKKRWRACLWSPLDGINTGYHPIHGAYGIKEASAEGNSPESAKRALVGKLRGKVVVLEMQDVVQAEFDAPDDLTS